MDALFSYIRTHSYITEDDRPALTTIPKHTGDKDAVVYTVPVVYAEPPPRARGDRGTGQQRGRGHRHPGA